MGRLHELGVEVEISAAELKALPAAESGGRRRVQHLELSYDAEWRNKVNQIYRTLSFEQY